MLDVMGKELKEGQTVVTNMSGYTDGLRVLKVMGFTPKKVRVVFTRKSGTKIEVLKFPSQLAVVNE